MIRRVSIDWMPYPEANARLVLKIVLRWADRYNSKTLEIDET